MTDSDHQLSFPLTNCKPKFIDVDVHRKHKVSLFDQLLSPEYIPVQSESLFDGCHLLESDKKVECKIEEESHHHIEFMNDHLMTEEEPRFREPTFGEIQCNCQRSRCNKNYCPCFKEQNECSQNCKCKQCLNKPAEKIRKYKKKVVLSPFWSSEELKLQ